MSWREAVKDDLRGSFESRQFHITVALYASLFLLLSLFMLAISVALGVLDLTDEVLYDVVANDGSWLVVSVVALASLFTAYPEYVEVTPTEYLGKYIGRASLIATGIALGMVLSLVVMITSYQGFSFTSFIVFFIATVLLGVSYSGIAVYLSVKMSKSRFIASALSLFVFLRYFWDSEFLPRIILFVVNDNPMETLSYPPSWYDYFVSLSPAKAHAVLSSTQGSQGLEVFALLMLSIWAVLPGFIGYITIEGER